MTRNRLTLAAALLFGLDLFLGPRPEVGATLAVLALACIVLEWQAVPLARYGFFSTAPVFFLAGAALASVGSPAAAFIVALGLIARVILRPPTTRQQPGVLLELVAALLAIAAIALPSFLGLSWPPALSALLGGAVYAGLWEWLGVAPEWLRRSDDFEEWNRLRRWANNLRLACAPAVVGVLAVLDPNPWYALALLPALLMLHRGLENVAFRVLAQDATAAIDRLSAEERNRARAEEEASRVREELTLAAKQRKILEGFARHLASQPTLDETFDAILATAHEISPSRTVVILMERSGHFETVRSRSDYPVPTEFASMRCVQDCMRVRRPVRFLLGENKNGLFFANERACVCLPLGEFGFLYLGRRKSDYSDQEVKDLHWLVGKASLALEASLREQAKRGVHHALQERFTLLAHLMEGSRAITSSLQPEYISLALQRLLRDTIHHDFGCLLVSGSGLEWEWGERRFAPEERRAMFEATAGGEARSLPKLGKGNSVLVAPLVTDRGVQGILAVGSVGEANYTAEHADLLFTIACQTAITLANAENYRAVVAARAELEAKQAQLVQSSKMNAVGTMVAGIAHELNTPLGAISLSLDAAEVQLESRPDQALMKLHLAQKAAHKLQSLVDRLLVYSRRSGDQNAIELSVAEVIRDALLFLEHRFKRSQVDLATDLDEVPLVRGKSSELQQVVMNLLLNAIDACSDLPPERRKVKISARPEGGWVLIVVEDRGRGIAPEQKELIFDPFFTTKPVGQGTGLGLSVSLEIVEQHGGQIQVESEEGQGTRFSIRLPALDRAGSG